MDLQRYDVIKAKIKYQGEGSVHSCINADDDNGLTEYSMVLGEQIITISKDEVIERLGNITDAYERKLIDKAFFNGLFFVTEYRLEEARA